MKVNISQSILCVFAALLIAATMGCGKKEEAGINGANVVEPGLEEKVTEDQQVAVEEEISQIQEITKDVVVSVDGSVLTKSDLAVRVKNKMNPYRNVVPAEKMKELEKGVRSQLVDDFVVKTILQNEADRKKITVSKKDIEMFYEEIKDHLPPDKELTDFLRENGVTRDDIILGIKIKKLVQKETGGRAVPSEKEIKKFYLENEDKFKTDETAHVRHILLTLNPKDDDETKAMKKEKIEKLRKQIMDGADFAEVAAQNSECPSKENGGDLGEIKRDQTVKPFEDAAFSQEINVVGPVVTTEFGYHIIEVLGRTPSFTVPLAEVKDSIALHLEQQKEAEIFMKLLEDLRKKTEIIYYKN